MLIPIGLIIAFVLIAVFARRGMRLCRWRMDRARDRDGLQFFRCAACGAEVLVPAGKTPQDCRDPRRAKKG
ncbi:MAG: hypothetical protein NWT12_14140 [Paracoccaceae bacterium]|jgi:hypothetical protein|nr:hypothetical protein [Paracoccaceae bacterium]MDP5350346.1 hypothetical protein [Paracoccaceae bacterium]MDP5367422.1 hypothetical protein [Paracoccaceae bacterium]